MQGGEVLAEGANLRNAQRKAATIIGVQFTDDGHREDITQTGLPWIADLKTAPQEILDMKLAD
ncbi:hypothetical protein NKH18_45150 [Streptomyces sp. M10(2022)]